MDIPLDNETQNFSINILLCAEKQPHLDAQPCRGSWSEKHSTTATWMRHRQTSTIKILHEVFHQTEVGITVCIRRHNLMKCNSQSDIEAKRIRQDKQNGLQ